LTLLHPILFGAGLACIAIPIVIHLLMRRRRKPVKWGAMRFLLEAYRKHKSRLRLEQLLLLATRCLLIGLIAAALARPILGASGLIGAGQATTLYILVDNSLTAQATGEDGESALDRHKEAARDAIESLTVGGDRASVIALGGPASPVVLPPSSDLAGVAQAIDQLTPTDSRADLSGAISRLRSELSLDQEEGGRVVVLVLSEFLAGSADLTAALETLAGDAVVVASAPDEAGRSNVSIIGVDPVRSVLLAGEAGERETGQQSSVAVRLRRSGSIVAAASASTIRVRVEGTEGTSPVSEASIEWTPGTPEATANVVVSAAPGAGDGVIIAELVASDEDTIAADNTWRRPIEVRRSLKVGLITPRRLAGEGGLDPTRTSDWLRVALAPESVDRETFAAREAAGDVQVVVIDPGSLDSARLADLDAVFLPSPEMLDADGWSRMRAVADRGGLVVIFPPASDRVQLWTDLVADAMDLPWQFAREAVELDGATITEPARRDAAVDLFSLINVELEALVRPVRVRKMLPVAGGVEPGEAQLTLRESGAPIVLARAPGNGESSTTGRGLVVYFASSLSIEWTNLAAQPALLPIIQETLRQGVGRAHGSWSTLAGGTPRTPTEAVELRSEERQREVIALDRSNAVPVRHAGLWRAVDRSGASAGVVAVNADPAGGRTDAQSPDLVRSWLGSMGEGVRWLAAAPGDGATQLIDDPSDNASVSVPLLLAALGLAVVEVFLARWFSHALVSKRADRVPEGIRA